MPTATIRTLTPTQRREIVAAAVRGLLASGDLSVSVSTQSEVDWKVLDSTDADAIVNAASDQGGASVVSRDSAGNLGPMIFFQPGYGWPASIVCNTIPKKSPAWTEMWETIERMG